MNAHPRDSRERSGWLVGGALAAAALAAGLVVFGAVACSSDSLQRGLTGTPSNPDDLLAELKSDKGKIDNATDQMMKRIDQFNSTRKPGERTIQFSEIFYEDLSPEQRDVLNTMVAEEKNVAYKSLLTKIIDDRNTIRDLQEKVLHLEQTLPDKFVVAKKGDSHIDLAMNYLVSEAQLAPDKAKSILKEIDLSDEVVPGNKVWFFYDPQKDNFRTYITRGEAGQTPLAVRRAMKRQIITERDTAQAEAKQLGEAKSALEGEVATLNNDVQTLTSRRSELESEVSGLQQNKADLEANVSQLSNDLAYRKNSLYYHAAAEGTLKDQGVLSGVLKHVKDVKPVSYEQSVDLRQSTTVTLQPSTFGLQKIKEVRVLPAIYQEGRDFQVQTSEDGSTASLVILDPDIFRGKEVILSIKG